MDLILDTSKLNENMDLTSLKPKGDIALDDLWKTPWINLSLTKGDINQIEEVEVLANKIIDSSDIVVVIADGLMVKTIDAMISGDKAPGSPDVIVFGNTLSAKDFADLIQRLENKNYSVIAVSTGEESICFKAAFSCIRKMLIEKYGPEGAGQRMNTILGEKKSYMEQESVQDDIAVMSLPKGIKDNCYGNTAAVLLPMAVAGIDIKEYLEGFGAMVADPAWDIDGTEFALWCSTKGIDNGGRHSVYALQREMKSIANWIEEIICEKKVNVSTDIWLLTEKETTDIALPSFPGCSEDGSLNVLLKEHFQQLFELTGKDVNSVKIQLPSLSAYNMGQLNSFIEISFGITSFILHN